MRNFGNNIQRDKKFTSLFISLFLLNTTEDKILDFSAPSSGKVEIYGEVMVSLTATVEAHWAEVPSIKDILMDKGLALLCRRKRE
ncbi:hypothetical protein DY000_02053693 [Brassica cretica]|uniref:Uncharacterized protein n=1 Tax=Brassica cretica TaxID=69181 RepID=A0ABQ7AGK9_BRACR|nr:hypothetical protein DY000_02053693 [Brassica cretica]